MKTMMRTSRILGALFLCLLMAPWAVDAPVSAQAIPVINEAIPDNAEQGTFDLDVVIVGKNFDRGSKADFYVKGTYDPGGITVKKTKFVVVIWVDLWNCLEVIIQRMFLRKNMIRL